VLPEADEQALWEKRGLLSQTSRDLGFRSNPRTNGQLLQKLASRHEMSELLASGLWLAWGFTPTKVFLAVQVPAGSPSLGRRAGGCSHRRRIHLAVS
jgi:hypothetical protein